jgi:hypothetical protein
MDSDPAPVPRRCARYLASLQIMTITYRTPVLRRPLT